MSGPKNVRAQPSREAKPQAERTPPSEQLLPARDFALPFEAASPRRVDPWTEPAASGSLDRALIVPDGFVAGEGQIERSAFLERVRREVVQRAAAVLAPEWSPEGCPYIERWFADHRHTGAETLERLAARYARFAAPPSSAEAFFAPIVERLAGSIARWRANEDITGDILEAGMIESDVRETAPHRSLYGLGPGRQLSDAASLRVANALGVNTSELRIHDDAPAGARAEELGATAFTVGSHIAFASGAFAPGTLRGDAILAHELAHVTQQGGASARGLAPMSSATELAAGEADADRAAYSALGRVYGALPPSALPVRTTTRSGLALQRCDKPAPPTPQPPPPTPDQQMRTLLTTIMADSTIGPTEWQQIRTLAAANSMQWTVVGDIARSVGGTQTRVGDAIGMIGVRPGEAMDAVRGRYTATYTADSDALSPDVLPILLEEAMRNDRLDFVELDTLRRIASRYEDIGTAMAAANISTASIANFTRLFDIGGLAWNSLEADTFALPIVLNRGDAGAVGVTTDLRITYLRAITGDGMWDPREFPAIRALLLPLGRAAAKTLLMSAGFGEFTADRLAQHFTKPDAEYRERLLLDLRFHRDGNNLVIDTPNYVPGDMTAEPAYMGMVNLTGAPEVSLGDYTFSSGLRAPAIERTIQLNGRPVPMVLPNRPAAPDTPDLDAAIRFVATVRVNEGVRMIPAHHIALIRRVVVDPGTRADAAADAGYDGTVTFYYGESTLGGAPESRRIMIHEVGHLVSFRANSTIPNFWTEWLAAVAADGRAISLYGTHNKLEDFAESYLRYLVDPTGMVASFPARAAIVARLVAPPAPVTPTPATPPPNP